ncbi:hypothetical protein OAT16_03045 [Prolixibacteraceae bacterium]|nr:hypothetical protein [Prolixibacteraceae bacterium]
MKKETVFTLRNCGIWLLVFCMIFGVAYWKSEDSRVFNLIMSSIVMFPSIFPKGRREVLMSEKIVFCVTTIGLLVFYAIEPLHTFDLYATIAYYIVSFILWYRIYRRFEAAHPEEAKQSIF